MVLAMSGRPNRGGNRTSRIAVVLVASTIVAASVPAAIAQSGFDEMAGGHYVGTATAAGNTKAEDGGITVTIGGGFTLGLDFVVPIPQGETTGTWRLSGNTVWKMITEEATAVGPISHSADGNVTGDRQGLILGTPSISSVGSMIATTPAGSRTIPVDSQDTLETLEFTTLAQVCDVVTGDWILSWNSQLAGASFSPTFRGDWTARRFQLDDQNAPDADLLPRLTQINEDIRNALAVPSQIDEVPILPLDILWGLIEDVVQLVNELNNLSPCDRALLGPDQVQQYITDLTAALTTLVTVYLDNIRLNDDAVVTGEALLELATMLASVGGVGEGAVRQEAARQAQEAVESHLDRMANNADDLVDDPVTYFEEFFGFGGGE
jgi:hypothetical protein